MNLNDKLILAIDFDGTIVDDAYPKVGKPKLFAIETLKKLQEDALLKQKKQYDDIFNQ